MANIFVAATATFNGKALTKGKKEISAFDQQVKKLGKTFAGVFGARALFNYSKKAVQAFAEDEKAAKALEIQLRNTGFAFAAPEVENYIANLQRTTGVLDDQLRPAFQQLLTVTGSVSKSQEALNTALNISAATGKSLTEVSAALTRGFSGNTTGLSRLGAGISKATLKAGKMEDILAELNAKFAGQASARLDTYAGKMDLLRVAAADASETIGKSLIDAISKLGKDTSIENLTNDIDALATSIASVVTGVGALIGVLSDLRNTPGIKQIIDVLRFGNLFDMLKKLGELSEPAPTSNFTYSLGASATRDVERAKEILRLKTSNKLRQDEINKMKAKSEVDKLEDKFNLERIALIKALGEATDAETKLRLQSKLAILDNNEALAKKYLAELAAAKAATDLTSAFNSSTIDLKSIGETLARLKITVPDLLARVQAGAAAKEAGTATSPATSPADTSSNFENAVETLARLKTTVPSLLERIQAGAATFDRGDAYIPSSSMPSGAPSTTTAPVINVNVEGSLTSLQEFETTIQDLLLKIYKQNGDLAPAGFIQ
jgi:hypothetical protein